MRNVYYLLLPVLILFLSLLVWNKNHRADKFEKIPKLERVQGKFDHEFEITKDPKTGTVPRERLFFARKETVRLLSSKNNPFELEWDERGPNEVGGRTRGMIFDLNDPTGRTVFAGGVGGGMWKHTNITDGSIAWEKIGDQFENIAITAIVQDPTDPNVMFFGTGEGYGNADAIRGLGIWRSTDGGDTWEISEGARILNFQYIQKMIASPSGTIYVASRKGLFATEDQGENWTYLLGENRSAEIDEICDVDLSEDGTLYACVGLREQDGIYRRDPGADNFTKLDLGLRNANYERIELSVSKSNPNRLVALVENGGACQYILRSDDRGNTWTEMTVPSAIGMSNFARNQAWYDLAVEIDPQDENRIFIGGIDVLLSEDGGENWQQISQWFGRDFQYVHADQHNIFFSPFDPSKALFCNDGGVYYCDDVSPSFPQIEGRVFGYNTVQYYAAAMHPNNDNLFIGGTQDNGSHIFDQGGLNPGRRLTGGDGAFCHIDQLDPNIMITSYVYSSYYFSIDGGNNFRNASYGNRVGRFINPTTYNSETKTLIANYEGGNYLRVNGIDVLNTSEDIIEVDTFNNSSITALCLSPNISDRVYFGLSSGRIVYVDNASSVVDSTQGVEIAPALVNRGNISSIAVSENDEEHIIVTYSNYGVESVFETRDGGANWQNIEGNLPDMPIRWGLFVPGNDESFLLATEMGVWITSALRGENTEWFPSNEGLANTRVDMLRKNQNGTVLAATHGRGIFTTNSFKDLNVSFTRSSSFYFTSTPGEDSCQFAIDTLLIPVLVSKLPEATTGIGVSKIGTWPEYMELATDSLFFTPSDTSNNQNIEVYVRSNSNPGEHIEDLGLALDLPLSFNVGSSGNHRIFIIENFLEEGADEPQYPRYLDGQELISSKLISETDFGSKIQYVWTAEELKAMGLMEGPVFGIEWYSFTDLDDSISVDLDLSIFDFGFDEFPNGLPFANSGSLGFSGDWAIKAGVNTIRFNEPYIWDGSSNISIQLCLKGLDKVDNIFVVSTETERVQQILTASTDNITDACNAFVPRNLKQEKPFTAFLQHPGFSDNSDWVNFRLEESEVSYVVDSNKAFLAALLDLDSTDNCLRIRNQTESTSIALSFFDGMLSRKHYSLETEGPINGELALFFRNEEVDSLLQSTLDDLKMMICTVPFKSASADDCSIIEAIEYDRITFDSVTVVFLESPIQTMYLALANGSIVSNAEEIESPDLRIYPQPFDNRLIMDGPLQGEYRILDLSGRVLLQGDKKDKVQELNTSNLNKGMYFIELKGEKSSIVKKLMKY